MKAQTATASLVLSTIAALVFAVFYRDYVHWLEYADGNPPDVGNLKSFTIFRGQDLYMWMCGQNDTDSSPLLEHADERRFLAPLPERGGSRPALVKWHVPQRTWPKPSIGANLTTEIHNVIAHFVGEHTEAAATDGKEALVKYGISRLEGLGAAMFVADAVEVVHPDASLMYREIFHLHKDLSFHTYLAPRDAAEVIDKGWGQRFALAGQKGLVGRIKGKILPVGMLLIYPPRNRADLEVVKDIMRAAIGHSLVL